MPLTASYIENVVDVAHRAGLRLADPGRVAAVEVELSPANLAVGRYIAPLQRIRPQRRAGVRHVDADRTARLGVDLAQPVDQLQRDTPLLWPFLGQTDDETQVGLDVRRVLGKIAHTHLDPLGLLVLGDGVEHRLAAALRADVDPLAAGLHHPLDELRLEQLHAHLPAPGHVDQLHQPLHRLDASEKVVIGVVHRVDPVVLLQPVDLVEDELIAVLPPGALHDDLVIAESAAEGAAAADVDRDGAVVGAGLQQICFHVGQQIPARREVVQILDEGAFHVDHRLASFVLPRQPAHVGPVAPVAQLARELLRRDLALVDNHEVDVTFAQHLLRHDRRVDAAPDGGDTQRVHALGRVDGRFQLRAGDGAEADPQRPLTLHRAHEGVHLVLFLVPDLYRVALLHQRVGHVHDAEGGIHIAFVAEIHHHNIGHRITSGSHPDKQVNR